MRLRDEECWARLRAAEHAVLCTTNAAGSIDAVPTCLAVVGGRIATPIDTIKPKRTAELGRRSNLQREAHATLLCEHWDADDWARLWWVRARLVGLPDQAVDDERRVECEGALRARYPQYETEDFAAVLVFAVTSVTGWSGAG